jgi:hypothetical protein
MSSKKLYRERRRAKSRKHRKLKEEAEQARLGTTDRLIVVKRKQAIHAARQHISTKAHVLTMLPDSDSPWVNGQREQSDRRLYTLDILRNPDYQMRLVDWNGRCVLTIIHCR